MQQLADLALRVVSQTSLGCLHTNRSTVDLLVCEAPLTSRLGTSSTFACSYRERTMMCHYKVGKYIQIYAEQCSELHSRGPVIYALFHRSPSSPRALY